MPRLVAIYWRDIPQRVMVRAGRWRRQHSLGPRFQAAMERAALRAGKGQSHALLDDWRREESRVDGEPRHLLDAAVEHLDRAYDHARLQRLARGCGWAASAAPDATPGAGRRQPIHLGDPVDV